MIENLDKYTGLKCIWLDHNYISKIENLEHLKKLKCLYLHHNRISRIENLSSLQNLVTINLSNNLIKKIEILGSFFQESISNQHNLWSTKTLQTGVDDSRLLYITCFQART